MDVSGTAANSRSELLGGGSEIVELALLAAHAAAAVKRAAAGGSNDAADLRALAEMRDVLSAAAGAVAYFGSAGRSGSVPTSALATRVDAAIDAALNEQNEVDPQGMSTHLREVADQVGVAAAPGTPTDARGLGEFLSGLSTAILRQTGHVGEIAATI